MKEKITFTLKDHDSIAATEIHINEIKGIISGMKDSVDKRINEIDGRLSNQEKEIQVLKDYVLTSKIERRTWSIIGGIISAVVVTVLEALILHLGGKL